ncbi:MAG TPA: nucleoside triphosphate pyrophosphatase [Candidatus Nanopelagicales bacterium]|nr:nucleoside triphosphate pyrophosphatase [Candidatus Nanopelagicales bacterium]
MTRVVLASASPARRALLRAAGIEPEVVVSGVDEDALEDELATQGRTSPAELCEALAVAKGTAVGEQLVAAGTRDAVVVACDSVLDLDGVPLGKPDDAADAVRRWRAMRGRTGILRTGHFVGRLDRWGLVPAAGPATVTAVASTLVVFADLDDPTIEAYVATGEPLHVAGAFTLDGLGGPFVERIDGDPSNVVGLSLPLLRRLVGELDVAWTDLWHGGPRGAQ